MIDTANKITDVFLPIENEVADEAEQSASQVESALFGEEQLNFDSELLKVESQLKQLEEEPETVETDPVIPLSSSPNRVEVKGDGAVSIPDSDQVSNGKQLYPFSVDEKVASSNTGLKKAGPQIAEAGSKERVSHSDIKDKVDVVVKQAQAFPLPGSNLQVREMEKEGESRSVEFDRTQPTLGKTQSTAVSPQFELGKESVRLHSPDSPLNTTISKIIEEVQFDTVDRAREKNILESNRPVLSQGEEVVQSKLKLKEMNGVVDELKPQKVSSSANSNPAFLVSSEGGASVLSGGEFLRTLGGLKKSKQPLVEKMSFPKSSLGELDGKVELSSPNSTRPVIQSTEPHLVSQGQEKTGQGFESNLKLSQKAFSDSILDGIRTPIGNAQEGTSSQPFVPRSVNLIGHVTKGAMARDRFSSEALQEMSSTIRNLSTQGGGEMRIRLKPENLGELHLKVRADGGSVGLQIRASDASAKQVLEGSLNYLRENLAKHNLNLGNVSVSAGPSIGSVVSQLAAAQLAAQQSLPTDSMFQQDRGFSLDSQASQSFGQSLSQNQGHNQSGHSSPWMDYEPGNTETKDHSSSDSTKLAKNPIHSSGKGSNLNGQLDVRA